MSDAELAAAIKGAAKRLHPELKHEDRILNPIVGEFVAAFSRDPEFRMRMAVAFRKYKEEGT